MDLKSKYQGPGLVKGFQEKLAAVEHKVAADIINQFFSIYNGACRTQNTMYRQIYIKLRFGQKRWQKASLKMLLAEVLFFFPRKDQVRK